MADGVPAPDSSRRTTRVLVIAAGALVVALGVLVTLPGRGTPTVVARPTPSAGATPSAVTSGGATAPTAPTAPVSSPAVTSPSPGTGGTAAGPVPTVGVTTAPTTRPGLPGVAAGYPPRRPSSGPPTRTSSQRPPTATTPAPTRSTARSSPLPGFGFGQRVTLLDPAVLDRRVTDVGGVAVMQTIPTSASLPVRQSASWVVRQGLAGTGCLSLESVSAPGSYLVSSAGRLRVAAGGGSGFAGAATFCVLSPALDGTWGVSLDPWNQSGVTVTRRSDGTLAVLRTGLSPTSQTFKLWTAPA